MRGKKVSESKITHERMMMPSDSNPTWREDGLEIGAINGGAILNIIDNIAGLVALRHCRTRVVTASIDRMDFLNPVHVGEMLIVKASVNYTGTKSLEVGVRVETENLETGAVLKTGSAYLTFVAVDKDGKPIPVPPIIPETEEEIRRYNEGKKRREVRLEARRRELEEKKSHS